MFDITKMMGKVKEVQQKMQEAQSEIAKITTSAEVGAGMVKVTVNGSRQVTAIEVDDDLMKPEEKEMLQDLVASATNKALQDMEAIIKDEMAKRTEGMMPNIPGLDLNNFTP